MPKALRRFLDDDSPALSISDSWLHYRLEGDNFRAGCQVCNLHDGKQLLFSQHRMSTASQLKRYRIEQHQQSAEHLQCVAKVCGITVSPDVLTQEFAAARETNTTGGGGEQDEVGDMEDLAGNASNWTLSTFFG